MSTESKLVIAEMDDLIRAHNVAVEYFAQLADSGIISMTPGVVDKLIRARKLVEEAQQEFRAYQIMIKSAAA